MRQIILDTETTGLEIEKGHRILEIAAVEILNRKLTGEHFHCYINPERESEAGALAVHGITSDFLKDKPLFKNIAQDFLNFVNKSELIIHNADFDVKFLNREMQLIKLNNIRDYCKITDTLSLAKMRHPGQRNSLDALCKRYNIDNTHRQLHGALLDANLLAKVYLAMTGGQRTMFGEDWQTSPHLQKNKTLFSPITRSENLRIIRATPEEEKLHAQRLLEVEALANTS